MEMTINVIKIEKQLDSIISKMQILKVSPQYREIGEHLLGQLVSMKEDILQLPQMYMLENIDKMADSKEDNWIQFRGRTQEYNIRVIKRPIK